MKKKLFSIILLLVLVASVPLTYNISINKVNAAGSYTETPTQSGGKIIEWSSNTYVEYWWEANKPETLMYKSEFTNGIVEIDRMKFFNSTYKIKAQSIVQIPDYIRDINELDIEFVSNFLNWAKFSEVSCGSKIKNNNTWSTTSNFSV